MLPFRQTITPRVIQVSLILLVGSPLWGNAAQVEPSQSSADSIKVYHLPAIEVFGNLSPVLSTLEPVIIILGSRLSRIEAAWQLENLPGIFTKSYGGPGTLQTAAVGGGAAAHTSVMIDGIPMNSPQNGMFNLAQIPASLLGSIVYLGHGGSTLNSGAALSGTINLGFRNPSDGVTISAGTYGYSFVEAGLSSRGYSPGIVIGRMQYEGNYHYDTRVGRLLRHNSDSRQDYMFSSGDWAFGKSHIRSQILLTDNRMGVPGPTSSLTPNARQQDNLVLATSTLRRKYLRGRSKWEAYYLLAKNHYENPSLSLVADHDTRVMGLSYEFVWMPTSIMGSVTRVEFRREAINSTNAAIHEHDQGAFIQQLPLKLTQNLEVIPTIRYSTRSGGHSWWTGEGSLRWKPLNDLGVERMSIFIGRNYRRPSFNDLFWVPGGNPELRPEASVVVGSKGTVRISEFQILLSAIQTRYNDLIVWVPGVGGLSHAENIKNAETRAINVDLQLPQKGRRLGGELNWNLLISKNLVEGANYGKQLRYSPMHTWRGQIRYQPSKNFTITAMGGASSSYITYYSYPDDNRDNGRLQLDSHLRWLFDNHHSFDFAVTLSVENLLDVRQGMLPGYPLAGRSYTITIHLERK